MTLHNPPRVFLGKEEGIKIPKSFTAAFRNAVHQEYENDPAMYTTTVVGTLAENCRRCKMGDDPDYISVPIRDQDGNTGGYIHVWGWTEVKTQ